MPNKTWKDVERRTAKMMNGQRNQVGTGKPDVTSDWLVVEVKHRKSLPKWIADDLEKARTKAKGDQLGIVLLHQRYKHDDVIILSRKDFEDWFGWMAKHTTLLGTQVRDAGSGQAIAMAIGRKLEIQEVKDVAT